MMQEVVGLVTIHAWSVSMVGHITGVEHVQVLEHTLI